MKHLSHARSVSQRCGARCVAAALALLLTRAALAVDGGGVTEIGKPVGNLFIYTSRAPFDAKDQGFPGEERDRGSIDEEIQFLFPSYLGAAPDSGAAYTNSRGVFWAEAIKRHGASPDTNVRDGVVASAHWAQQFSKDRDSAWMTYTVTKARLYVTRGPAYIGGGNNGSRASIWASGMVITADGSITTFLDEKKSLIATPGPWSTKDELHAGAAQLNYRYTIDSADLKELVADRLVGYVDLSQINVGQSFYVLFQGDVSVDSSLIEGPTRIEATYRDPLNTGADGIVIETDGLTPLNHPVVKPIPADRALAMAIQPDGAIVTAGYAYNATTSDYDFALARYAADGSLDGSFGSGGKSVTDFGHGSDGAQALALQSDGKIVAVGHAANGATDDLALARYNIDGSLDNGFGTAGKVMLDLAGVGEDALAVAMQSDGKIVVTGYSGAGTSRDFAVARFTAQGQPDTSFGGGDGWTLIDFAGRADVARAIGLQSDGRIVVTGSADQGVGHVADFALARLTADGTVDSSFGSAGLSTLDFNAGSDIADAMAITASDAIVVAGSAAHAGNSDVAVARFDASGHLDSTFGTAGSSLIDVAGGHDYGHALTLLPDGSAVVVGATAGGSNEDFLVVHVSANGALDAAFGNSGKTLIDFAGGDDWAAAVAQQADGKLLVAGYAATTSGDDFALARLTAP